MNFDSRSSLFNFPITSTDNPYDIRKIEEDASKALKNINSIYNEIMSPKGQNSDIYDDYYDTPTHPVSSNCKKSQYVKTCCNTLKELCIKCERSVSRCSSCKQCKCSESNYDIQENSEYVDSAYECDNVSRCNFKVKCTIPKPFTLYEKIEQHKRTKEQKIFKIKQDIDEKIDKELKIRASCKPVPKSTHLPLYNQMVKERDKHKAERKEKCLEILNSSKPFNLHALQRSKKYKSTPDLASDNTCNFKAKPVPKHILSEKVSEKLKNKEEVRKMLISERAKQTIEKSYSPFSRKNICSSSLINLTNVPKSHNKEQTKSKNISEITERLYLKKCNETMNSWNKKVLSVDTSKNNENIDFNNMFTKELVLSKNKLNKEEDLPFMYFPIRMSNAAIVREKSIRSEILARKEREERKEVEEYSKKKVSDDMLHKLHYLIPVSDREREIQERVKSFRESQVRRKHEYEKELQEIMNKVSKQKLLLERQSKSQLFILFEHSMGCALFKVTGEFEDDDSFMATIQKNIKDVNTLSEIIKLVAFQPFSSGREALEYMNNSSEGILLDSVQQFLESNLPKSKKKRPVVLGVQEPKLATAIAEAFGINCSISKEVFEIIRGIRLHFHELVPGVKDLNNACKAQLALGHHYARAKVKFNVNRIDNMVIQSISLIDQLDKDINTFAMRVREWYSFHFPELIKVVPENHLYVKCVEAIKDRRNMPDDIQEQLENILMDSQKAENILELARSSMGMEISVLDMENITMFATRVSSLMNRRRELMEYLKVKMHNVAPNLAALIGDTVGARLIAHAGSLINLAKFPASTVQILGAEKALFRAIKTRGNTPKYGLIYHSTFIGRAGKTNKGRISRYLANKCSVATRIDCFREIPTEVFGSKLKQQVEDRLKFYETGDLPTKNVDVMVEALSEADVVAAAISKQKRKAEKKEKKRQSQLLTELCETSVTDIKLDSIETGSEKKKKRKRESVDEFENEQPPRKKLSSDMNKQEESNEVKVEDEMEITDPEILKQIKKAKKKEKKRLKALQMSANGEDSLLTSDGSFLNNTSVLTNESINSTMNKSTDGAEEEHLDNGIIKKKKKKKNKHQNE